MRINSAIGLTLLAASLAVSAASAQSTRPRIMVQPAASVGNSNPYLGIGVKDIDSERASALKMKDVRGAEITNVYPDSPAAKAGLKDGDVVLDYNGQPVEGKEQLARMVQETPVGRQVKIGIWRNGAAQTVTATMEERKGMAFAGGNGTWVMPDVGMAMPPEISIPEIEIPRFQMMYQNPRLGIMGEALGQQEQLAEFFGVKEGVLVKSVTKGSAAEKAGIKAGDVITKVDDSRVNTSSDITRMLREHSKTTFNLTLVRGKKEMTVPVTVEAAVGGRSVRAGAFRVPRFRLETNPIFIRPALRLERPAVRVIVFN